MAKKRRKKKPKHELLGYDLDDEKQRQELYQYMLKEHGKGKELKEVLEVPPQQLENAYAVAYSAYQQGRYEEAASVFRYLLVFDKECYKYLLGLAASLHKLEQWAEAAGAYQMAAMKNPADPVPFFHAADCFVHLGEVTVADYSLAQVIKIAEADPKYKELAERADLIRQGLKEISPNNQSPS